MRCLVTGGCGFIGSHIAEALAGEGRQVRIYDNLSSGHERNLDGFRDRVELVKADIRDVQALGEAMRGVDVVFHEAALVSVFDSVERPRDNHDINITGTFNVLQAAREAGVKRALLAGSAAAYGNQPDLPKREGMLPEPESPYGLAKVAAEYYMAVFAKLFGLETVVLRYFNVFGPRQDPGSMYSGVISKFTDTLRAGRDPVIYGDGQQTRDFVFVKDVVQANLAAMSSPRVGRGEVFNVGTGVSTSLLELLDFLRDLTGRPFQTEFREARAGDIRHSVADIGCARQALDFAPRFSVRDGLRELLAASPA